VDKKVKVNLFKTFITVFENGSYSQAAKLLIVTPSAISQNIRELEKHLGVQLFHPNVKGVRPTKEAGELYELVKTSFSNVNKAIESITEFKSSTTGEIRISSNQSTITLILDYLDEFNQKFPRVLLKLYTESKKESISKLKSHDIDIVVSTIPIEDEKSEFKFIKLIDIERSFFTSKSFAQKNGIEHELKQEDFRKFQFLLPDKTRSHFRNLLETLDINTTIESFGGTELRFNLVKKGRGIGYATKDYILQRNDPEIVLLNTDLQLPASTLVAVINKAEKSKPALEFVKGLAEFCKKK